MINIITQYLDRYNIKNCRIFIGVSGGPDSVALLSLLDSIKHDYNLELVVAYVNHGIRSENENDKDFNLVKKLCNFFDVELNTYKIPNKQIETEASSKNCSVESIARDYRYSFFNRLVTEKDYIAIGHNSDDQKETQIMRFFQGSSIDGLLGIKGRRQNIIRPMIDIEKHQILDYLQVNSIKYNIDYTNNELDYLRNNIRHVIIPKVEQVFPAYKKALKNIENELLEYKNIVDSLFLPLKWVKNNSNYMTNYDDFINLPPLKRREEIYDIFDKTFNGDIKSFRLPKRFLEPLFKSSYFNGEIILNGYGYSLIRIGKNIIWEKIDVRSSFFKININKSGDYRNSNNSFSVKCSNGNLFIRGLSFPFNIRSYTQGYAEVKILKTINKDLVNYNDIVIVEKNNRVYAIIYNKKIIYIKSKGINGLYIDIL